MSLFNKITLFICSLLLISCAEPIKEQSAPISKDYFQNLKGCFLLYNIKTKNFEKVINDDVCREQFPACSTFKVPLAVIAFDSGVLKDENVILKWDGIKGIREETNRDHNAKTWMRDSVVWFSQRITSKLGSKKFQKYLDDFNYGNKDITAGITTAWIISPSKEKALKISAYEQVDFMKKLWTNALPVTERSMKLTQDITFIEESAKGYRLSGKTGSGFYDKEQKLNLGWFVSHIQNGEQEYIAVTTLSDLTPVSEVKHYGGPRAKELTKNILEDQGLW